MPRARAARATPAPARPAEPRPVQVRLRFVEVESEQLLDDLVDLVGQIVERVLGPRPR